MNQVEFEHIMESLCFYFQKGKPNKGAGVLWFEEVKNIPSESLEYIKKKIFATRYPDNIPKTFWAFYHLWLEDNPQKKAHESYGCDQCEDGYLHAYPPQSKNLHCFLCGDCRSRNDSMVPYARRSTLIAKGWTLHWVHLPKDQLAQTPIRDIKSWVDGYGQGDFKSRAAGED